jgi:hypothetical protein
MTWLIKKCDLQGEAILFRASSLTAKPMVIIRSFASVTLKVYDLLRREVETLLNEEKTAGNYEIEFNADYLTSGLYFYKIFIDGFSETKEMMLIR